MNITLYKSATCPQCKVAKAKLDKKGLPYTEIYIEDKTPDELAAAGVKGIPTLFVDGEKISSEVRTICKWIDSQEVVNG